MTSGRGYFAMPGERVPENYIDRLAEFWPEPREQLHFGGWPATYDLVDTFNLDKAEHLLDICCGEGGTACWLAKEYGVRVSGMDALESAIETAKECAKREGVEDLTDFKVADIFELPFDDSTFDLVYGQDPDGIAHEERADAFRDCYRVLRPGGILVFQHWLPQHGISSDDLEHFEHVTVMTGYPYMTRLSVADYIEDLKAASFVNIQVEDKSEMYKEHTMKIQRIFDERKEELDQWHAMLIELYEKGARIGVRMSAEKEG